MDLDPFDTRSFLFHCPHAQRESGAAMDAVNAWLGKNRSHGPYANLLVRKISVTPDGADGVYVVVVCTLGQPRLPDTRPPADPTLAPER